MQLQSSQSIEERPVDLLVNEPVELAGSVFWSSSVPAPADGACHINGGYLHEAILAVLHILLLGPGCEYRNVLLFSGQRCILPVKKR